MQYSGIDNLEAMKAAKNYNHWLAGLVGENIPSGAGKIVDFGAGNGMLARMLQAKTGKSVLCVEPAENMRPYLGGLKSVSSLAEISDNSQDFVYSLNVLEHIEDDCRVLMQLFQKLRPGGRIILYVPAFPCLYSSMDKAVGHFRRYRRAELIDKVQSVGFTVEYCRYADFAGWFAAGLFKLLPGRNGALKPGAVRLYDSLVFPLSRAADVLTGGRLLGKNLILSAGR